MFAKQAEILCFTNQVIEKYNLKAKARTGRVISSLTYNEQESKWKVRLKNGETLTSKFVIGRTGRLSRPSIPNFKEASSK